MRRNPHPARMNLPHAIEYENIWLDSQLTESLFQYMTFTESQQARNIRKSGRLLDAHRFHRLTVGIGCDDDSRLRNLIFYADIHASNVANRAQIQWCIINQARGK